MEKGANIGALDYEKETPLSLCVRTRQVEVAKYLIRNGANINTVSRVNSKHIMETHLFLMLLNLAIAIW